VPIYNGVGFDILEITAGHWCNKFGGARVNISTFSMKVIQGKKNQLYHLLRDV
jgi:hypothetical protein